MYTLCYSPTLHHIITHLNSRDRCWLCRYVCTTPWRNLSSSYASGGCPWRRPLRPTWPRCRPTGRGAPETCFLATRLSPASRCGSATIAPVTDLVMHPVNSKTVTMCIMGLPWGSWSPGLPGWRPEVSDVRKLLFQSWRAERDRAVSTQTSGSQTAPSPKRVLMSCETVCCQVGLQSCVP